MRIIKLLTLCFLWLSILAACEEDQEEPKLENKLRAKAGADRTVSVNTLVTLDGSASSDGNGKAFAYAWTLKSQPAGSQADLSNETTDKPSFTPDIAGAYVVELSIANEIGQSKDEVTITANISIEDSVVSYLNNPALDLNQDGEADIVFTTGYFSFADGRVELQFHAVSTGPHQILLSEDQPLILEKGSSISSNPPSSYTWSVHNGILLTLVDHFGQKSWKGVWKGQQQQYLAVRLAQHDGTYNYGWICISADEEQERIILHQAALSLAPDSGLKAGY